MCGVHLQMGECCPWHSAGSMAFFQHGATEETETAGVPERPSSFFPPFLRFSAFFLPVPARAAARTQRWG